MTGAVWQAVLGRAEELGLVPLAKSCEIAGWVAHFNITKSEPQGDEQSPPELLSQHCPAALGN